MKTKSRYIVRLSLILLASFISIILYIYFYHFKQGYYFLLTNFLTPYFSNNNKYLIANFDNIIKPYYTGEILVTNRNININRNSKNDYSLLDSSKTSDLLEDLKLTEPSNSTIDTLLHRLIPFIHFDGKSVNFEDLIVMDVLNSKGSYFPSFHTDVEWGTFYESHGFQIWILLEEDDEIKPRGNMFIMETDIVKPGAATTFEKDKIILLDNNTSLSNTKDIIKIYNSLDELNPRFKYLNANIGEVFIMSPSTFHSSDPKNIYSSRRAINMRVLYKPTDVLKMGNFTNSYSKIIKNKHNCIEKGDYCEVNFSNKDGRYKFI